MKKHLKANEISATGIPQVGEYTKLGKCLGTGHNPFPELVKFEKRAGVSSFQPKQKMQIISKERFEELNGAEVNAMEKFYSTFEA